MLPISKRPLPKPPHIKPYKSSLALVRKRPFIDAKFPLDGSKSTIKVETIIKTVYYLEISGKKIRVGAYTRAFGY